MRRMTLWLAALLLCLPVAAFCQSIPVTGNLGDTSSGIPPGMSVKFELYNCGSNIPKIPGSFVIVKQNFTLTPDPTTGILTGTILPNDVINCGGSVDVTRYNITVYLNGIPQTLTQCYHVLASMGTFNLNTATPCTSSTPPAPPGGPFDASYLNLTLSGNLFGTNAVFTGTVRANGFILNAAPTPCGSGAFMTGLSTTFVPICSSPSAAPVVSVFARAGAVVAASGDYNCGQITGAICSLPTFNYQTIQQTGTPFVGRAKLNFLSGAFITVSVADNSGANSTDVTVTGVGDSSTTCNSNGCWYTKADGTIIEAGNVAGCVTVDNAGCTVTVTFPHALSSTSNLFLQVSCINSVANCSPSTSGAATTTGFTGQLASLVYIGGAGSHLTGSEILHWQLFQKN